MRTPYAPAGSRDMLRRLVPSIMAQVLGPILAEAILERETSTAAATTTTTSSSSSSSSSSSLLSLHTRNNRIASMAIRAFECWYQVTDVSLAQVKAICTEVQIDFVSLLSDAMYSDSQLAIEALAELPESATTTTTTNHVHTTVPTTTTASPRASFMSTNNNNNNNNSHVGELSNSSNDGEPDSVLDELVAYCVGSHTAVTRPKV